MLTTLTMLVLAQNAATTSAADVWTSCLVRHIERTYRGTATADGVVDGAMRACAAQELGVRRSVEREYGDQTAAEVSAELDKLNRMARAEMRKGVVRLRAENAAAPAAAGAAPRAAPAPSMAGGRVRRPLEFFNKCHYPVRYFIYHVGADRQWRTQGWYNARAFQPAQAILDTGRRPIQHLEGERLFLYGETTGGGPFVSWNGATPVTFGGARYSAKASPLTVVNGKYQFGLNCPGR
ncbi:MAG TPA: hypothetical protein VF605_13800 [Allosphingosinicella sp.]|jgi:hypothetical protein